MVGITLPLIRGCAVFDAMLASLRMPNFPFLGSYLHTSATVGPGSRALRKLFV
ncbi:MAG: hypothetical protein AAFP93_01330 [Bacteroidota bacterium]